jgi:hypothetical protein
MYAINYTIDAVQNAKKQFTKTFVTDDALRISLDAFVDAQTAFAKQIVATTQVVVDTAKEAVKIK